MKMTDKPTESYEEAHSKFNSGISLLMRLDKILTNIKDLVLQDEVPKTLRQAKKVELVKAFFVQAYPLIKKSEEREALKKRVFEVKPSFREEVYADRTERILVYSHKLEDTLNFLLMDIQDALQDAGALMPSADDAGLF